jgi:hypothetical protein
MNMRLVLVIVTMFRLGWMVARSARTVSQMFLIVCVYIYIHTNVKKSSYLYYRFLEIKNKKILKPCATVELMFSFYFIKEPNSCISKVISIASLIFLHKKIRLEMRENQIDHEYCLLGYDTVSCGRYLRAF